MSGEPPRQSVAALQSAGVLLVEDGNHGENRPRPEEFSAEGEAFVRAADMDQGRVRFDTCSRITATARSRIRKGIGAPRDILLSHKGTVGKLALIDADCEPFVCSPQTTFWRVLDDSKIDRDFLFYFMQSADFTNQLKRVQGETDMAPYVSLTAQRRLTIPLPEIHNQTAMTRVLCALDEKIALNRLMTGTLEGIARALFKSWFIDFDTLRPVASDRSPVLSAPPASLFSTTLTHDGLPSGWRMGRVGDVFDIVAGNTPSTEQSRFWGGIHAWATPKDLSKLSAPVLLTPERALTEDGLRACSSGLLPAGTLLLSSRAPIGYLAFATRPTAINQGIAAFRRKDVSTSFAWMWCHMNMALIKASANGSTFLEISKGVLRQLPMIQAPEQVMRAFAEISDPLVSRLVALVKQNATLTALRDALLPRLISGELRLRDAETIAAGS